MKDYYNLLDLNEEDKKLSIDKFTDKLKKNYRKKCLQFHPDKQNGKSDAEKKEAEEKFKEISEAYSVLSDPEKKSNYDRFGTADFQGGGFHGMDEDLFSMFRNMHEGMFGGGFGGFREETRNREVKGADKRVRLSVTLEEVFSGGKKTIKYRRKGKCKDCNGTGSKTNDVEICRHCHGTGMLTETRSFGPGLTQMIQSVCPHCNGTGKVVKNPCRKCSGTGLEDIEETIEIVIPKGVASGQAVQYTGKGDDAPNGLGQSGNLIVVFEIARHSIFATDGQCRNLYCKTDVNILDCITGCEKEVRCIDGTMAKINIPQGTKENSQITVKGKGMPTQFGHGDMIVYINHIMPKDLTKDEKKILDELKKSKNFKK